ncbi:diguanylate cyclase [Sulfuricurvum sp.]|uniref:diguanylate cyclase n=1 Tax=Sulfuricurvum sp. TaxID=2025608 RepID=UPI003BAE65DF
MLDKLEIVERQNNALQKLNEIASISNINPKETLRQALIVGKEYYGLEFAIVSHIVGEDYTIEVQSSPTETLYDGQLFALGSTYCKTTLEIDDVLAITDVTKSKYVGHPCHKEFELVSYIGAPVRVNGIVYGTINFSSPTARHLEYDDIDIEFMRLLARWAGAFLERQFALDELSLTKKRFELIFENNASGILVVDENRSIIMANKRFCEMIGYSKNELLEGDVTIFHTSKKSSEIFQHHFIDAQKGSIRKLEYELKPKNSKNILCEFFGSPIELSKNSFGVVWSIIDITAQKELQHELEKQAITDYLTGLYNRRYFTNRLEEELSRIKRSQKTVSSLLMFDLDKFKLINDTFGHLTGDTVLREFANILKNNLRKSDIIGRIGGEEFAMILPDTDLESAVILADRIREDVAAHTITADWKQIHFTVSIGLTSLSCNDNNSDSAFSRVDDALYKAKKNGRNRVEYNVLSSIS